MNNIHKYILSFIALGTITGGCTNGFEKFNTNPYEPQKLPVTSFFPAMLDCLASPEENPCQRNNTFWACFGGYVTAPNSWNRRNLYATFNIDDAWNKWTVDWYFTAENGKGLYPGWFNVQRHTGGSGYFYQMAQLIRVYTMQMVASLQGPLPYSKVANGDFYVAYDDEKTAWHTMFEDLDAAIAEIQAAALSGSMPLAPVDRIYNGDNNKWLKFANTLKLRMAMRLSNIEPDFAKQKAQEAITAGVMSTIGDSAYDNLNGRYSNGFYQISRGWATYEVKANACIVSYMNGYNDPRREKYFTRQTEKSDAEDFVGVRSGIAGILPAGYTAYSGLIYETADKKTAPMPIMLAAEAAFLQAEYELRWGDKTQAATWYEKGIRLSFEEWGASSVDTYLADDHSIPASFTDLKSTAHNCLNKSHVTIKWDPAASDEKMLERIITQKWIAGFPNGLEAWCDFRRTGYPYIFPPFNNLSTDGVDSERGQRRLRFSQSEYTNNKTHVQAAVQMLSNKKDSDNTELWWALKDEKKY